jgi:hypothetical protein
MFNLLKLIKMKKVFMLLAVAAFFSTSVVSCGEEKKEEGTENAEGGDAHGEEGHDEHAH